MKDEIKEITEFIKKYVKESNTKGVIIGLSGGIDSAVTAVLAKNAIGSKNVHCYYLPMIKDKQKDFDKLHIDKLCEKFDLTYQTKEIGSIVELMVDDYENASKVAYGNIQARVRMAILYMYANIRNCIVCGTTNKSEFIIGYFTKYGDGASDIEPIRHLYKTDIFKLAKELDIPNEITDKPPTAGLWDGQTDESDIGVSYEHLDKILKNREKLESISSSQLSEELKIEKDDIDLVKYLIKSNKHKRREPPSIKKYDTIN